MEICTIGVTKRTAADFFGALRRAGVKRVLDVRLKNSSQLAGFSKRDDLPFFLAELCGAEYSHELRLAPTPELLSAYRKRRIDWREYERRFLELMGTRQIEQAINRECFAVPTALLCTEPTADRCHRRLVLEYLQAAWSSVRP